MIILSLVAALIATSGRAIALPSLHSRTAGPEIDKMRAQYSFFAPDTIPANTYKGVGEVKTISVGAQWVTSDKQD